MKTIPSYLLDDNQERSLAYKKDPNDEEFLYKLNQFLLNHIGESGHKSDEGLPLVFIVGMPRTGKTLLSQYLSSFMDIGFINNLIAKFWLTPVYGIRLSQALNKFHIPSNFCSDYGKTEGLFDPHDFSYFWRHWLAIDSIPYDAHQAADKIDWEKLCLELIRITAAFDKACLFKSPNPSFHMARIDAIYRKTLFIYLERDFIDVAISLCRSRRDNFGDPNHWYGQWPEECRDLSGLPYQEQIPAQLSILAALYERQFSKIPEEKILRLHYEDFCRQPEKILTSVAERLRHLYDYRLEVRIASVKSFTISRYSENDDSDYGAFVEALKRRGLPPRIKP